MSIYKGSKKGKVKQSYCEYALLLGIISGLNYSSGKSQGNMALNLSTEC
jgi:hypothetical protein